MGYPIGMIILIVLSILIFFGLAHRVLDRLRLSDKTALFIIGLLIIGSFFTIPLLKGPPAVSINLGGALVPLGLSIYLFVKAGTSKERTRALIASILTITIIGLANRYFFSGDPWHTGRDFIDPLYFYPIIATITAYAIGRSRRSAFIAAILGVLSLDFFHYFDLVSTRVPGKVAIGGAGAFDAIIIAGIGAVMLAEIIGETRERIQGGPKAEGKPPKLLSNLKSAMPQKNFKPISPDANQDKGEKERKIPDA